jgi:hypothetical protein
MSRLSLEDVLDAVDHVEAGDGYKALCPAHDDNVHSLSIHESDSGKLVMKCHAGCDFSDIVKALKSAEDSGDEARSKTKHEDDSSSKSSKPPKYVYRDEKGNVLFRVIRGPGKKFVQQHKVDGEWVSGRNGIAPVLYALDKIQKKAAVSIVEGEKDVKTLWKLGFPATTAPGGASAWRDEYADMLVSAGVKTVYCFRDNDDPGLKYQRAAAASCLARGLTVKLIELPGVGLKEDVSDWIKAGHTEKELASILDSAQVATKRDASAPSDEYDDADQVKVTGPTVPEIPQVGYVGLGKRFAQMMSSIMEPPKAFFYFSFLTHLGAYVSDKVQLDSALATEPRLYTVLLAKSGMKKSAAMERTAELFHGLHDDRSFDVADAPYFICDGAGSGEGLAEVLQQEKRVLLSPDEFQHLTEKMKIENSSLSTLLTTLFERKRWSNVLKGKQKSAHLRDASLSLLSATTFEAFDTLFDGKSSNLGLLNRLWLVPASVTTRVALPDALPKVYKTFKKELRETLEPFASADQKLLATMTKKARTRFKEWYDNLPQEDPKTVRLDGYGHRLMILLAICAGRAKDEEISIDEDVIESTIALLDWQRACREAFWPIIADTRDGQITQKIIRAISLSDDGLTKREIFRAINAHRVGPLVFERAIDGLIKSGQLKRGEGTRGNQKVLVYRTGWLL